VFFSVPYFVYGIIVIVIFQASYSTFQIFNHSIFTSSSIKVLKPLPEIYTKNLLQHIYEHKAGESIKMN
jgi:ABC-type dipeptide/oligopeptide/nickel transport system permease component